MKGSLLAIFGATILVVGWVLLVVFPDTAAFSWGVIALGALLLAGAAILEFRRVRQSLTSRKGQFGLGFGVSTSLFLAIVVLVNAIGTQVSGRLDLTGMDRFTLTSQTRDVLEELDADVEAVTFFTQDVSPIVRDYAQSLLSEYEARSLHLSVRSVDPEVRPEIARSYGVNRVGVQYGSVVFRSDAGQRQVLGPQIQSGAEYAFTSALAEVTGTRQKRVYFLAGHGERNPDGDYGEAARGMRENLFDLRLLDLERVGYVPDDAAAVIVAAPARSWSEREAEILNGYLEADGRLMVLFDPDPVESVVDLLSQWWIRVEPGVVIDAGSHVAPNRDNLLVPRTRNAFGLTALYLPGAAATIPVSNLPSTVRLEPLAWSSQESWLETSRTATPEAPARDPETERAGPLAVGAILATGPAERSEDGGAQTAGTRLLALGDSDFAANGNFTSGNNAELFLSSVSWLTEGEEVISVDRRVLVSRRLLLAPEQARFLNISSVGLLPVLLLVVAGWMWWRRR